MVDDILTGVTTKSDEFVVVYMTQEVPFTNWSAHQIKIWGRLFPTVEHAYQFKKFSATFPQLADRIATAKSAWAAKKLGWSKPIDSLAWDKRRVSIMTDLIKAKIHQHEDVRSALRNTGNLAILEKDYGGDEFWGVGANANGSNRLGKIWMALRESIR